MIANQKKGYSIKPLSRSIISTDFSNLRIAVDLSWIEEQHRSRKNNTFIYSLLSWFVPPSMACVLPPYFEEFQSQVFNISIYSDSDFNADFTAGSDLTGLFAAENALTISSSLAEVIDNKDLVAAKSYLVGPSWLEGQLVARPDYPTSHVLTVLVTLADGRTFDLRTSEFLLSGV